MDKVVDLKTFRSRRNLAEKYFGTEDTTNSYQEQLKIRFLDITDEILEKWRIHVIDDSLNELMLEYFKDRLIDKTLDYVSDLNAVAKLENHIRLSPIILGPGATTGNSVGWGAGFYLNGLLIATPEFNSEVYARCFNILLYLSLRYGPKKFFDS